MSAFRRTSGLACLTLALLCLVGCDEMTDDPSLLEGPRILAVKMEPRILTPGVEHTLTALTHDLGAVTWNACITPFIPDADLTCPVPIPNDPLQAVEPTLSLPLFIPEGIPVTDLWLKLSSSDTAVLPGVFRIGQATGDENPSVTAVSDPDGNPITTLQVGSSTSITPTVLDPLETNRLTISYFTTHGSFASHRTLDGNPSVFEAPAEPATVEWTIIVRDGEEGVGWGRFQVEVVE